MDKKPLAGQDDETADKTQTKKPARKPDVNYVPSPPEVVDKMLELADLKKDDVLYDLGCGDGRIVIAAAKKYKCKAVGIEIDPQLVHEARDKVKAEGLEKLVEIQEGDIFKTDLEPASVVTMYLLDHLNAKLVPQLQKLKPGTRIVSHDFKIADYPPDKTVTVELRKVGLNPNVYLWVAPLKKKGDKGK
jgi:predicted RNA methylase